MKWGMTFFIVCACDSVAITLTESQYILHPRLLSRDFVEHYIGGSFYFISDIKWAVTCGCKLIDKIKLPYSFHDIESI